MKSRVASRILTAVAAVAICAHLLAQAPAPSKPGAKPDFSGVWKPMGEPLDFGNLKGPGMGDGLSTNWYGKARKGGGYGFQDSKMEEPKMLPWAEARYKAFREGSLPYLQPVKNVEPFLNCLPSNMPWVYDRGDPFEIVQSPKKMVMLFSNDGHWREVYLDGRKNPEGAPDTYMGYASGKWEGDVLVVQTTGITDMTWIDRLGHPHSDALRVEERFTKVAPDRFDIDFVFDDPKTYVKPWKGKKIFRPSKGDVVEEFACEDQWEKEYPEKVRKEIGDTKAP